MGLAPILNKSGGGLNPNVLTAVLSDSQCNVAHALSSSAMISPTCYGLYPQTVSQDSLFFP